MGICFALTDRMGFSRGWLMNGGDLSAKSSKGVDDSVWWMSDVVVPRGETLLRTTTTTMTSGE